MSLLNIGGDKADASYRYKMPAVIAKVEGRGNGVKTAIMNMAEIGRALHTDPSFPLKFCGIELGAITTYSEDTERALINGIHTERDLQEQIGRFIDVFVLCPGCRLPELTMKVKKGEVRVACAACGFVGPPTRPHRLTTYIIKQARDAKKKKGDGGSSKKEKKSKKKRDKKRRDDDAGDSADEAKEADVTAMADAAAAEVAAAEQKKSRKERKEKKAAEDEWYTDTSAEATEARKAAEYSAMTAKSDRADAVDKILETQGIARDSTEAVLKVFLAERKRTPGEVMAELRRIQLSRSLDDTERVKVLLAAVVNLSEPKSVPAAFHDNAAIFQRVVTDSHSAGVFIGCIEEMLGVNAPACAPLMPHVLKALYDDDVLEEDHIVGWYDSPPEASFLVPNEVAVRLRRKAEVFVTWLKEAEEDEEDEEDEE